MTMTIRGIPVFAKDTVAEAKCTTAQGIGTAQFAIISTDQAFCIRPCDKKARLERYRDGSPVQAYSLL